MKVRFVNPNNRKFGTEEHVENTAGRTLIALGECEEVKLPPRGSADWLAARNELAKAQVGKGLHGITDTALVFVDPPTWEVIPSDGGRFSCARIRKCFGFESVSYSAPPLDCPPKTAAAFFKSKLDAVPAQVDAAAHAEAKRAQSEYNERLKTVRRY